MNLDKWFGIRVSDMNQGIPADASPLLSFIPGGKANHEPSWYGPSTRRLFSALVIGVLSGYQSGILEKIFGGPGKSSIRMGFGMFYNRMGGAIATDSSQNGVILALWIPRGLPLDFSAWRRLRASPGHAA